ncbi:MAG: hypothetical protein AAGE37_10740 [Pseudomonadota bacterium]
MASSSINASISELFVLITNRLEEAHEQSVDGHAPNDRVEALAAANGIHSKIEEIRILLKAIEQLAASDGSD